MDSVTKTSVITRKNLKKTAKEINLKSRTEENTDKGRKDTIKKRETEKRKKKKRRKMQLSVYVHVTSSSLRFCIFCCMVKRKDVYFHPKQVLPRGGKDSFKKDICWL